MHVPRAAQSASAPQSMPVFLTQASAPVRALMQVTHSMGGMIVMSAQSGGIPPFIPPHAMAQGAIAAQAQLVTTSSTNLL